METKQLKNSSVEVLFKWIMFTAAITGMEIGRASCRERV